MTHVLPPTVVIVPGLRGPMPDHWQTLLAAELPCVIAIEPLGRDNLDLGMRMLQLEEAVQSVSGPVILVAHSGGTITVAHWATMRSRRIAAALLVTPPDFDRAMPGGYPTTEALQAARWLPVPRAPLPFPSIVAASADDPLATRERTAALATDWCSQLVDLGPVGHMNPASGFGHWQEARQWIATLAAIESSPPAHTEN